MIYPDAESHMSPAIVDNPLGALQGQRMEAIGRLAGGVAHDFNNLLTVISGYGELLREGDAVREDMRPLLEDMLDAARRASDLTRQLLAFSRRQTIKVADVDVNQRVREMEKLLGRLIGEHIQLVTSLDPDAGSALVDPSQFDQVIVNLVVNARDAMPDGGRVTIGTGYTVLEEPLRIAGACVPPGEYVSVSVCDTGAGMSPEVLRHIFEPFYSTKAPGSGTGLGLATVYGIIKQHNGFIFASSTQGYGARFDILLPRTLRSSRREISMGAALGSAGGSEHVLLVEDEDALRRLGADMLRRQGYTVSEARDGVEALSLLDQLSDSVALVITDVIMPRMGGPELARRATDRWPALKMLFTSGYVDEALGQSRSLPEGTHFIAKPFTRTDLTLAVRSVLDGTKLARPS
jgi:CheY-like chemotaxis protein